MGAAATTGYLKEVRVPLTALFGLLLLSVFVEARRVRLTTAVIHGKYLATALALMDLPTESARDRGALGPGNAAATRPIVSTEEAREELDRDLARFFVAHSKSGAIEAMGQFIAHRGAACVADCALFDLPVQVLVGGSEDHQGLLAMANQAGTKADSRIPDIGARKFFAVDVLIIHNKFSEPAVVPADLAFTNTVVADVSHPRLVRSTPGDLTALYRPPGTSEWLGPFSRTMLAARLTRLSRSVGVAGRTPADAYLAMARLREQEEVSLPIINVSVNGDAFMLCALVIATALAAWASFLMRTIRQQIPSTEDEPWILVEPFRRLKRVTGWNRVPAWVEVGLFGIFALGSMGAPIVIAALLLSSTSGVVFVGAMVATIAAGILSVSLLWNYLVTVRLAVRPAGKK